MPSAAPFASLAGGPLVQSMKIVLVCYIFVYVNYHNKLVLTLSVGRSHGFKTPKFRLLEANSSLVNLDDNNHAQANDTKNKMETQREQLNRHYYYYIFEPTLVSQSQRKVIARKPGNSNTKVVMSQKPASKVDAKASPFTRRSELMRDEHRPPSWLLQAKSVNGATPSPSNGLRYEYDSDNALRRLFKATTQIPLAVTADFIKLISSAHSPIRNKPDHKPTVSNSRSSPHTQKSSLPPNYEFEFRTDASRVNPNTQIETTSHPVASETEPSTPATLKPPYSKLPELYSGSNSGSNSTSGHRQTISAEISFAADETNSQASRRNRPSDQIEPTVHGQITSSTLMVKDEPTQSNVTAADRYTTNQDYDSPESPIIQTISGRRRLAISRRPHPVAQAGEQPTRRPATIIKYPARNNGTREPIVISIKPPESEANLSQQPPAKIELVTPARNQSDSLANFPMPQTVRLISKQKHKYDDSVTSPTLTVIDTDTFRLPPNTTAVHNNRLLVRIKPGLPPPSRFQPTTEYPYYNPVAGITPPYPSGPPMRSTLRPSALHASGSYGLLRPPGANSSSSSSEANNSTISNFGAPNIKFPAPAPSIFVPDRFDSPAPDRLNISVPDDARPTGPYKVPDRLVVESEEQINRPPSSLVISEGGIIAGQSPYGTNQSLIIHVSTTTRPHRYTTTRRINIISSNTTVITTNPDQLHEVVSDVIAGSHTQHSTIVNQNNVNTKPGLLASISALFSASVPTTIIAVMTSIKTVLLALMVLFLPPLALTLAIMQAVNLG